MRIAVFGCAEVVHSDILTSALSHSSDLLKPFCGGALRRNRQCDMAIPGLQPNCPGAALRQALDANDTAGPLIACAPTGDVSEESRSASGEPARNGPVARPGLAIPAPVLRPAPVAGPVPLRSSPVENAKRQDLRLDKGSVRTLLSAAYRAIDNPAVVPPTARQWISEAQNRSIETVDRLGNGNTNWVFAVRFQDGDRCVVSVMGPRLDPAYNMPRSYAVTYQRALESRGLPVPRNLTYLSPESLKGEALQTLHQQCPHADMKKPKVVISSWVDGASVAHDVLPSVAQCERLGEMLGLVHEAGQEARENRRVRSIGPTKVSVGFRSSLEVTRKGGRELICNPATWTKHLFTTRGGPLPDGLPRGAVHGDFNKQNILWGRDGTIGAVIDFDRAHSDAPLLVELAEVIVWWCIGSERGGAAGIPICHAMDVTPNQRFYAEQACALLKGYHEARGLTDSDFEAFPDVLTHVFRRHLYNAGALELLGADIPYLRLNDSRDRLKVAPDVGCFVGSRGQWLLTSMSAEEVGPTDVKAERHRGLTRSHTKYREAEQRARLLLEAANRDGRWDPNALRLVRQVVETAPALANIEFVDLLYKATRIGAHLGAKIEWRSSVDDAAVALHGLASQYLMAGAAIPRGYEVDGSTFRGSYLPAAHARRASEHLCSIYEALGLAWTPNATNLRVVVGWASAVSSGDRFAQEAVPLAYRVLVAQEASDTAGKAQSSTGPHGGRQSPGGGRERPSSRGRAIRVLPEPRA